MFTVTELAQARRDLLIARRQMRIWEEGWPEIQAEAEERVIALLNGNAGSNDAERKRNLAAYLARDTDYQAAISEREQVRFQVEELETQIQIMEDHRRAKEWEVRGKLADGLLAAVGLGTHGPSLVNVQIPDHLFTPEEVVAISQAHESEDHR